ncbi:MAG: polyprenyl synthetase family protein [Bacteroidales bacterium]|nr:polyprenyl synthetase family protein [Bacteroidales bacterium]
MYSLKEIQEIIEKRIKEIRFIKQPVELYEPIEYIISLGGKKLRPAFVLLSCNMFSENIEPAILPAIGLELFHNFTLIHDDIMDKAPVRRGKPTIHVKWNENTAILSGDAMVFLANQFITFAEEKYSRKVWEIYNETALKVCEGQQLDMNFELKESLDEDEYLNMIFLKTSVLIAACLKIGAILGGAQNEDAERLYNFGKYLGLAFQLQDDLLDVYGDAEVFGKKHGGDIVCNKKTYLLVNALNTDNDKIRKELLELLHIKKYNEDEKISKVKSIYNRLEIRKNTENKINEFFEKAIDELKHVDVKKDKLDELINLANKLLIRKY